MNKLTELAPKGAVTHIFWASRVLSKSITVCWIKSSERSCHWVYIHVPPFGPWVTYDHSNFWHVTQCNQYGSKSPYCQVYCLWIWAVVHVGGWLVNPLEAIGVSCSHPPKTQVYTVSSYHFPKGGVVMRSRIYRTRCFTCCLQCCGHVLLYIYLCCFNVPASSCFNKCFNKNNLLWIILFNMIV